MPACKKIVAGPQTVSILSFNDNRESLSTYKINIISCEYIHGKALGYRDQVVRGYIHCGTDNFVSTN